MPNHACLSVAVLISIAVPLATACSGAVARHSLRVGTEPGSDGGLAGAGNAGSGMVLADGGIAVGSNALSVHVEDFQQLTITIVTIACAGDCADIVAVAQGGNAPYSVKWEDGSIAAQRHVCPSASPHYSVAATDTAITSGEFPHASQTARAQVTAQVLACPADGGTGTYPGLVDAAACDLGGVKLPEDLMPDIFGKPGYFGKGGSLPAGRYRLSYVNGCMEYAANFGLGPWTVQGAPNYEYVVIGASTSDTITLPPGTVGPGIGSGYASYDACVTANKALAPVDFDFAGGKLGIWQNDFQPDDNIAGIGGINPTWRLSFLGVCP